MPILFDRSICCDLNETIAHEWLVTNGKGGYAAGTVAGTLTRREQGLLVASPAEGTRPQLLVAKMDEEIVFDQRTYYLGTNEYKDGTLNPAGFVHLETFHLEEGFPVFTYHLGGIDGIMLEKRIWMPPGLNTTYIQYRLLRTTPQPDSTPWSGHVSHLARPAYSRIHDAQRALSLTLLPFAAYRANNEAQRGTLDWQFQVETQHVELDGETAGAGNNAESVAGCAIRAWDGARPYHIFAVGHADSESTFLPTGAWYWHLLHRADHAAGRAASDDLYLPGVFRTRLWPGEDVTFTMIITAEDLSWQTFHARHLQRAYAEAVDEQRTILQTQRYFGEGGVTAHSQPVLPFPERDDDPDLPQGEEYLRLLVQAGNRLVAERPALREKAALFFPEMKNRAVVVAGYYGEQEYTRDTLIALPGLLLATGRYAEARRILSDLGRCFNKGLLPNRMMPLPTLHEAPGGDKPGPYGEGEMPGAGGRDQSRPYTGADTALWFFYALDHYLRATGDYELLSSLADVLKECIDWYMRGTLNGIGVDAHDGLLQAQATGKALTWMNATTLHGPHTPITARGGKAVEINALWYHALSLMREWSGHFNDEGEHGRLAEMYEEQRERCRQSFNARFWYAPGGYLYDVIDGVDGDDASLRPNQLFALSLRHAVLNEAHRCAVLSVVTQHLLTPCGLRSLSPQARGYEGQIKQYEEEEQSGLHQGGAWPWLIGPYVDALLRLEGVGGQGGWPQSSEAPGSRKNQRQETQGEQESVWRKGIQLLDDFREQLRADMLGTIGSVYDGDAPRRAHLHMASAISIGELLRVYKLLAQMGVRFSDRALSV